MSVQALSVLTHLRALHSLDLEGNPLTDMPDYRAHVFEALPALASVDEMNKNGGWRSGPSDSPGARVSTRWRNSAPRGGS